MNSFTSLIFGIFFIFFHVELVYSGPDDFFQSHSKYNVQTEERLQTMPVALNQWSVQDFSSKSIYRSIENVQHLLSSMDQKQEYDRILFWFYTYSMREKCEVCPSIQEDTTLNNILSNEIKNSYIDFMESIKENGKLESNVDYTKLIKALKFKYYQVQRIRYLQKFLNNKQLTPNLDIVLDHLENNMDASLRINIKMTAEKSKELEALLHNIIDQINLNYETNRRFLPAVLQRNRGLVFSIKADLQSNVDHLTHLCDLKEHFSLPKNLLSNEPLVILIKNTVDIHHICKHYKTHIGLEGPQGEDLSLEYIRSIRKMVYKETREWKAHDVDRGESSRPNPSLNLLQEDAVTQRKRKVSFSLGSVDHGTEPNDSAINDIMDDIIQQVRRTKFSNKTDM